MNTNYSSHAAYWDWDEYDRSKDFDFWCRMCDKYGENVLSPMCAIGQAAAYMATKGYYVTALDYTKEMIFEGKKRFGNVNGLDFVQGDIRNFELNKCFDFCFIDGTDLHLLLSFDDVQKALRNINKHLRVGGGFSLELAYPSTISHSAPMRRFDPRVPRSDGIITWKEGDSNYDANTKKQDIHQILYVKNGDKIDSIELFVSLQYYDKEEIINAFQVCGFKIVGEFSDREFHKDDNPYANCFIELVKI